MISVFKNNFYRLMEKKARIILTLVLTAAAITAAVLISSKPPGAGHIALVADNGHANLSPPYLKVTRLDEAPPVSQMVSGKYDAVVIYRSEGTFDISTIRGDEFKQTLAGILQNPSGYDGGHLQGRGIGANILGYLLMFILLEGVLLMYMFSEDKEKNQIVRIAASPVPFTSYLLAQSLFTFGFIFVPSAAILALAGAVSGIDMGFGIMQYALLLALICAFSTAFSLFINALVKGSDTANMVGSSAVLLTTILAGSFYSFEKGNAVLEAVISVLPQKAYLSLVEGLEKGAAFPELLPSALHVMLLTLALFGFAIVKTRRDYVGSN